MLRRTAAILTLSGVVVLTGCGGSGTTRSGTASSDSSNPREAIDSFLRSNPAFQVDVEGFGTPSRFDVVLPDRVALYDLSNPASPVQLQIGDANYARDLDGNGYSSIRDDRLSI